MGSSQSVISAEGVVTALVVAGAVGVGYTQMKPGKETQRETKDSVPANEKDAGTEAPAGTAAKKNKKKKKATTTPGGTADVADPGADDASDTPVSSLAGSKVKSKAAKTTFAAAAVPPVKKTTTKDSIPGGFDTPILSVDGSPSTAEKKSKKKKAKSSAIQDANASGATAPNQPSAKSPTLPTTSSSGDSTQAKSTTKALSAKQKQPKTQQPLSKPQQQPAASSATKTQSQVLDVAAPRSSSTHGQSQPLDHSFVSIDTDESWTRVSGSRRSKTQASATSVGAKAALPASNSQDSRSFNRYETSTDGMDTTTTGNSSPAAEKAELEEDVDESFLLGVAEDASRNAGEQRKTLAEKLLPKPRKTAVDDMLETPANPSLARVIRVQSASSESKAQPAPGFSWGDYEEGEGHVTTDGDGERDADAEEDEEGWGVVKSRKPKKSATPGASTSSLGASATSTSSSTQLTKKQLQNKKRREAEKAASALQEKERLATLAAHKRQLELERMKEQQKKGKAK